MDGLCDVPGCTEAVLLGWRPLTEQRGRQICEQHWLEHRDPQDNFDLFEAFSFKSSAGARGQTERRRLKLRGQN